MSADESVAVDAVATAETPSPSVAESQPAQPTETPAAAPSAASSSAVVDPASTIDTAEESKIDSTTRNTANDEEDADADEDPDIDPDADVDTEAGQLEDEKDSAGDAIGSAASDLTTTASSSTDPSQQQQLSLQSSSSRRNLDLAAQSSRPTNAITTVTSSALPLEKEFPPGFHYTDDSDSLCRYLKPYELSKDYINLHCSFGYAAQKRYNIHYIDFGVLLFACGNTVQILDLFQDQHQDHRKKTVLLGHGRDSNVGIGAIAVHPSKSYFAVAEKGTNPNIYIYNYPQKEVVRILRRGTERAYADVQFSHTGTKLVSVGSEPDFLLTVWDWQSERVILRTKAFSQEVFRVGFSPVNEGRLLTSGTGHIRFWKMAKTFTGLKLQGMIGKFGQVELSDISAFVELPDGKVLSGTESGNMLMWDGNFIQYQVMRTGANGSTSIQDRRPCHAGMIEYITLDENDIITGGSDGYVRRWNFDRLEYAEASEEDPIIVLEPLTEILIGKDVHIRTMLRGDDHWIIQDYNGSLYKLWLANNEIQKLLDVHSGKINALITAPMKSYLAITAGEDATVRCWDIMNGEQLYQRRFNSAATCLLWASSSIDEEYRTILIGFEDGVVRVVKRMKDSFKLFHTFKPHTECVTALSISPDGQMLVTSSSDNTIFFLSIGFKSKCSVFTPLGFVKLPALPRSLNWSASSEKLLLACGQDVYEYQRPNVEYYTDPVRIASRDTYEITSSLQHRIYRPIIKDNRPIDPQEEEDANEMKLQELLAAGSVAGGADIADDGTLRVREVVKPKPVIGVDLLYNISACLYHPTEQNTFYMTLDGGGNREDPNSFPGQVVETLYECVWSNKESVGSSSSTVVTPTPTEPLHSIHLGRHIGSVNILSYSLSRKYLLLGTKNGGIQLRALQDLQYFFQANFHDGTGGSTQGSSGSENASGNNTNNANGNNANSNTQQQQQQNDRIGLITSVCTTFDDRFLLSVGNDGNFFAHSIDPVQALQHQDRSIELKIAHERRMKEEERLQRIKAKEDAKDRARKEEEEKVMKEQQALAKGTSSSSSSNTTTTGTGKEAARTREQKDREARDAKDREVREKEAKEKLENDRIIRLKLKEQQKNDKEKDDENWDHLSTRIPARSLTKLPLPDASSSSIPIEKLEAKSANNAVPGSGGAAASVGLVDVTPEASDITDPKTYSIEEAKLKQESDDRVLSAEKKKQRMRLEIGELRKEFVELLKKNSQLDRAYQLSREAFELDPKLREELETEAKAKIDEVRAELAWISEKHSLALSKLRAKFLDPLLVEHISLHAFRSGICVTSFRTPQLPPFLKQAIEGVHKMMEHEEAMRAGGGAGVNNAAAGGSGNANSAIHINNTGLGGASEHATSHDDASSSTIQPRGGVTLKGRGAAGGAALKTGGRGGALSASAAAGGSSHGGHHHLSEADVRKQSRLDRATQLAKLKSSKPDKNIDDPADTAAVVYAEKHMGDYKLKSDPSYIVPENQRVNAERKRRQMILLQESVHHIKMALNERFLALRDLKLRIIKNIKKDNIRLRELNELLGITEPLYEPEVDSTEWPEHRELYTKEDLQKFETEREKERIKQTNQVTRSIFSSGPDVEEEEEKTNAGQGGDGSGETKDADNSSITSSHSLEKRASMSSLRHTSLPSAVNNAASSQHQQQQQYQHQQQQQFSHNNNTFTPSFSTTNPKILDHTHKLYAHERTTLLEKIRYAIWSFDCALTKLRREKYKLDSDLKTTDLKILTLYQELYLLKDFEENENRLFNKLSKARTQKALVVNEMTECERSLQAKLNDIKVWQEKDKQVMMDFNTIVGGEKSEFYTALLKIFKKKVKRNKKKGGAGNAAGGRHGAGEHGADGADDDGNGDDSDNENNHGNGNGSSSDSDSDAESDSDESDDDSCPLHLDSVIYEKVLELREKRLEQEEILNDFNKNVSELNKTYERLGSRERLIDKELTSTENDIEAFQSEKQRALNLIDVFIPLKLNQMKYLTSNGNQNNNNGYNNNNNQPSNSTPSLPRDISHSLIFTSTGLSKLKSRITELGSEKQTLTRQFKELKKQHRLLLKELSQKRELIHVEKKKCEDVQMLKFGQIIDLNILEKVGVDEGALELRGKLKSLESTSIHKVDEWNDKIEESKNELARITEQNTRWLDKVAKLTKAQYDLEETLNNTTKNVHVADSTPLDDQSDLERRQLLELVQLQEREIDALKAEVHVLRRKGGHVYTPQV